MSSASSSTLGYDDTFSASPAPELHGILTSREMEIAKLIAKGLTNKEIALTLEISHWTVATHIRRIFSKTNVCRRAALVHVLASSTDHDLPSATGCAPYGHEGQVGKRSL